jgi:hypothetical protein
MGLRVPELVLTLLEPELGRAEPDSEIRALLKASGGLNLGVDYLPGSITFDPVAGPPPKSAEASDVVCFDAYVMNVDRTPKNPNLLVWHRALWLIDHGAALYFHHAWETAQARSASAFSPIKDHVLLPWADGLKEAGARLRSRLTQQVLEATVALLPEAWLEAEPGFGDAQSLRDRYTAWLLERLGASATFLEEAERARAQLV